MEGTMKRLALHDRKAWVEQANAIKLIENALKEARQGAFRVRNCHDFEKMCMPNRRRRSA